MNPALYRLCPPHLSLPCQLASSSSTEGLLCLQGVGRVGGQGIDRTKLGFPCHFKPLSELCYPPPSWEGAVHLRGSEELSAEGWGRTAMSLLEASCPQAPHLQAYILSTLKCSVAAFVPVCSQLRENCTYYPVLVWTWKRVSVHRRR